MINGKYVSMQKIPFSDSVILSREEQLTLAREIAKGYLFKAQRNEAVETLERVSILADHMQAALNLAIDAMDEAGLFAEELARIHATLACGHREAYPGEPVPGE